MRSTSDTNENRLDDPNLAGDAQDPKPPRIGSAEAPDAVDGDAERESVGGTGARRSTVEGVDEAGAERDAIRDRAR